MGVAGGAGAVDSMIPKSLVRDTAKSAKAGKFVPIAKGALGSYSRITSIPSIIQMRSQEKGSIWNNKLINNKFMQGDKQKLTRRPVISPKRIFTEKRLIDKVSREAGTRGLLRFAGRWIPWFGWGLLALDVAMISKCSYDCYNSEDNPPIA
ncbi:unnamed protein product [Commensalibacter communis]|uniref:hypothetical protein n=1 Tax=Commensalibacter communis TaxID=2972786 RepID=UPI0022FF8340|nr:hypothetical protein [Commensalibacter communis]CAI3953479.1 unnamed protein product [Commensalibacter communis]